MFITFEGGDGSGKTTQAKRLVERLNQLGRKAIFTREPGGSPTAERIRNLILSDGGIENVETEFLLITAARADHVKNTIRPALARGEIVVCDRFFDSSAVYQGFCKGLDFFWMKSVHNQVFGAFEPNLTFLIDVSPEVSAERLASRETNHYDTKSYEFRAKIRDGFLQCAHVEPNRFRIINGNNTEAAVAEEIWDRLNEYIR